MLLTGACSERRQFFPAWVSGPLSGQGKREPRERTRGTPENLSQILKLCFLNFKMYFNLKSHNFKANSMLLFSKQCHLKMFMIS